MTKISLLPYPGCGPCHIHKHTHPLLPLSLPLQSFMVTPTPQGITRIQDLSPPDMEKVRSLALLELTISFDEHEIHLRARRPAKTKSYPGKQCVCVCICIYVCVCVCVYRCVHEELVCLCVTFTRFNTRTNWHRVNWNIDGYSSYIHTWLLFWLGNW